MKLPKKVEEGRRQLLNHFARDFFLLFFSFFFCFALKKQMLSVSHCSAHTIRFGSDLGGVCLYVRGRGSQGKLCASVII